MGERRRLPYPVKGPMAIGHHDDREATWPEHPVDLEDRGDGIGEVLEDVGRDYGVEARVGERPETTGVEIDLDVDIRPMGDAHQLGPGLVPSALDGLVGVDDGGAVGYGKGVVARSDLHHGACEAGAEEGSLASRHSSMKADRPPTGTTSLHIPRSQRASASALLERRGGGDLRPIPLHARLGRLAADRRKTRSERHQMDP